MAMFPANTSRLPQKAEPSAASPQPAAEPYQGFSTLQAARGLGWASMGIAALELVAPKQVQRLLGTGDHPEHRGIVRVMGVRELMHGVSILAQRRPDARMTNSLWGRVAGDALDTALLAMAARRTKHPARFAAVAALVAGIGVLDLVQSMRLERQRDSGE